MIWKRYLWVISVVLGLVLTFFAIRHLYWLSQERARAQWKDAALARLATLSTNTATIKMEVEDIKALDLKFGSSHWTGDRLLVMTNGEHLVYASRHGLHSGVVNHLFLARGSDGKCLYSTFHFCNSMVMVSADAPPGSIAEFSRKYFAREFDGKSDVCLEKTSPE